MFESKYSKFLTVLLIVIILAIVGLLAFLGFDYYQKYFIEKDAKEFVDNYENNLPEVNNTVEAPSTGEETNTSTETPTDTVNPLDSIEKTPSSSSSGSSSKTPTYKGMEVAGSIRIPKTGAEYPIIAELSPKAIQVAVAVEYGPGPNQPGNTVIAGHNYRNGQFFSNNKKLNLGDVVYITDNYGTTLKYTIYDKFETTAQDTSFMTRSTNGAKEITLYTCLDDSSKGRLVILAKSDS